MCGIAGLLQPEGAAVDRTALTRMAAAIAHRGPDGEGLYVDPGRPSVGLVSRRLAVIDIPGGTQPMSTEDGRYTIVYNGEVFNASEVRPLLEARGHRFRSRCDTEVVLRGYAEWGPEVLGRLNGMWAFAVWDAQERRLFLARDRLGVKPLVYADTGPHLVFASELKALVASGLVERSLDLAALPHYLSFFVVPEPYTLVRGVRRLPAGHYLLADASGAREVRYWDCSFEEEEDRGIDAYRAALRELLDDSVRRRLASDVPLGVFLSGGVDSGLVAALAAQAVSEPLRTFTLGFENAPVDERHVARRVATALGTRHVEELVSAREAAEVLPDLLAAHDEPSQSLVQAHFVCRLARRDVTVVLSGTGGDELFSSYPTHRTVDLLARFDRLPAPARSGLGGIAHLLPGHRGRRFAALAAMSGDARATRRLLHQTDAATRRALLTPELRASLDMNAPVRHLEEHYARARARHPLNRVLYVYLKTYLPDELLRTLDTMSMLHSVEARTPLLDYRLVELAMRIPARHKMSLGSSKRLLREVAREVIGPGLLTGRKRGFSLPLEQWLRGALTERLRDVLSDAAVARRGVFDPGETQRLLHGYLDGDVRLQPAVMMLFAFEQWAQRWLDGPGVPAAAEAVGAAPPPSVPPELSVIVVNWNTRELLRNCLGSLATHLGNASHEVLVVDNASADGSADMVAAEFPAVRLVRNAENVGFGRANNEAMRVARGKWFLLLNSDARLIDDSVVQLLARVRNERDIGVAHCRVVFPDGRLQYTTYRFPSVRLALLEGLGLYKLLPRGRRGHVLLAGYWEEDTERDVDWIAGAFMLLPRQVFEQTGGFSDEIFMYGEDMDWCWRIHDAGWRIRLYPQAVVVHDNHGSSEKRWGERRVALCLERQLDIYRRRHGRLKATLFHLAGLVGALVRLAYFAVRSLGRDGHAAYYRDMVRHSLLVFRVHVGLHPRVG